MVSSIQFRRLTPLFLDCIPSREVLSRLMKNLPGERDNIEIVPCASSFNYPWPFEPFSQSRSESQKKGRDSQQGVCVWSGQLWSRSLQNISLWCRMSGGKALPTDCWPGVAKMKAGFGKTELCMCWDSWISWIYKWLWMVFLKSKNNGHKDILKCIANPK